MRESYRGRKREREGERRSVGDENEVKLKREEEGRRERKCRGMKESEREVKLQVLMEGEEVNIFEVKGQLAKGDGEVRGKSKCKGKRREKEKK